MHRFGSGPRGKVKFFKGIPILSHPRDISSDGRYLASGSWNGTVQVWSLESGRRCWAQSSAITGFIPPDNLGDVWRWNRTMALFASGSGIPEMKLWTTYKRTSSRRYGDIRVMDSKDEELISGSKDLTIRCWKWGCTQHCHLRCKDAEMLASASLDSTAKLWSTTTWEQLRERLAHWFTHGSLGLIIFEGSG
jgi:WD40 repeat protein